MHTSQLILFLPNFTVSLATHLFIIISQIYFSLNSGNSPKFVRLL